MSNFQDPPTTLSIYVQNSSTPLTLDVQFQTTPPLQMITNQLKENIIQDWLLYVIRSFFQVGFRFQYQLINLVWLSFDFFSFSWSLTICFFMDLYSCVCSCLKYHKMSFIYNYSRFWYSFCNQPVLFSKLENVSNLWNDNRTVHVNKRNENKKNQVTSYSNWPSVLLFDLAHKQCSGIIKGWLHFLTS